MELPFSYVERGETRVREVMVKVVLCERCVKKLMWKREREKVKQQTADSDTRALQAREALDLHGTGSSSRKRGRNESNQVQENRRSRSISPHRRSLHHRVVIPHVQ
jgi:protein FRA10AC1